MGAEVAAWKQSARAELAIGDGKHFAQGLLDLVKAYERIPHWVLLREAIRHGYPIWLLQLSVAVYRLLRVIRVDEAVCAEQESTRPNSSGQAAEQQLHTANSHAGYHPRYSSINAARWGQQRRRRWEQEVKT